MGGKQKQAQRTKGNARPSNSSRSAERLQASTPGAAALLGRFTGFASVQIQADHLTFLKASGGSVGEVDPLIDGDCRMLMKRMTKKDAITRLKALQEFQNLCLTCCEDSLLGALPIWPRLFNKLCLDVDRKVREATHNANNQLVLRMKRNMAPHIKSMMGNWVLGLCDPYAPTASAAKIAFNSAFSQEKRLEAIMFCKGNIFATIMDYLFHQTPKTLIDSEAVPVEVTEEMYNRVLSSSLLALSCVLDLVSPNEYEKLAENYAKIISDGKFWKFPKSQVPQVRSAWFIAIVAICGKIPALLEPHLSKLCPAVFGKLDETEPVVVSSVWDAALHILIAFENCWTHVNLQKAVLPKLMSLLSKGCDGNAKTIGPYLLPLLSKIPADIFSPGRHFYLIFFDNFSYGLELEKIQSSSSECVALVTALMECWNFVVIDSSSELQNNTRLAEEIMTSDLLEILKRSFVAESSRLAQTPLYTLVFDFLIRLRHLQGSNSDDSSSSYFRNMENCFWEQFAHLSVYCVRMALCVEGKSYILTNLQSMFSNFSCKKPTRQKPKIVKNSKKVRFSDELNISIANEIYSETVSTDASLSVSKELKDTDKLQNTDQLLSTDSDSNLADCKWKAEVEQADTLRDSTTESETVLTAASPSSVSKELDDSSDEENPYVFRSFNPDKKLTDSERVALFTKFSFTDISKDQTTEEATSLESSPESETVSMDASPSSASKELADVGKGQNAGSADYLVGSERKLESAEVCFSDVPKEQAASDADKPGEAISSDKPGEVISSDEPEEAITPDEPEVAITPDESLVQTPVKAGILRKSSSKHKTKVDNEKNLSSFNSNTHLASCVFRTCTAALDIYKTEKSFSHLKFVVEMNSMFACKELCNVLLETVNSQAKDRYQEKDVVKLFYQIVVLKWLGETKKPEKIALLVTLAFDVLNLMGKRSDRLSGLDDFCLMEDCSVMISAAREIIQKPHYLNSTTRSWLMGPVFSQEMLERADALRRGSQFSCDQAMWSFFELCMERPNGVLMFDQKCVGKLMIKIRDMLALSNMGRRMRRALGVTTRFFEVGLGFWMFPESKRLFYQVLKLGLDISIHPPAGPEDKLGEEVENSWKKGMEQMVKFGKAPVESLLKMCKFVRGFLFQNKNPIAGMTAATDFMKRFFATVLDLPCVKEDPNKLSAMNLLNAVLPTENEWAGMYSCLCRDSVDVHAADGKLMFAEWSMLQSSSRPDCWRFLANSLMAAELLAVMAESNRDLPASVERLALPHQLAVLNTLSYCSLQEKSCYPKIEDRSFSQWGDALWEKLYVVLAVGDNKLLLEECLSQARQKGFLYAYSLRFLVTFLRAEMNVDEPLTMTDSSSCVQVMQVLVPTMDIGRRLELLKRMMEEPRYSDMKWLAVVNACICRSGSAVARPKVPEKARKLRRSETIDKSEGLAAPQASATLEEIEEVSGETSENSTDTSEASKELAQRSEENAETLDKKIKASEESTESFEQSIKILEDTIEASAKSAKALEESTKASIGLAIASEESSGRSEESITASEGSTETSEESTKTSEEATERSEDVTKTSEESTKEESNETMEMSTKTSNKSNTTPGRSFEALEEFVEASELIIEPSEVNQNLEKSAMETVRGILRGLQRHKEENPLSLLLDCKYPDSWPLIALEVQRIGLLTTFAKDHWSILEAADWDFILCSLGSWLQSSKLSRPHDTLRAATIATAIIRLLGAVATTINRRMLDHNLELATEWREFFAVRFYIILLNLFNKYAPDFNNGTPQPTNMALTAALEWIPVEAIVDNDLDFYFDPRWDADTHLPTKVATVLNTFAPFLTFNCPYVRQGAYYILRRLVDVLPGFATKDLQQQEDVCLDLMPGALMQVLKECGEHVAKILEGVEFGEPLETIQRPYHVYGYLYAVNLVLQQFAGLSEELRSAQATILRDSSIITALLNNLFRLMSSNPSMVSTMQPQSKKAAGGKLPLAVGPVGEKNSVADIQRMSYSVYLEVLRRLPALVREWWTGLDRRDSVLVDKFTAQHASPLLLGEDISSVQNAQRKFNNMSIRTRPSAREVVASYDVEEIKFELIVRLAENHPLGPVQIETGRRLGVTSPQWRVWLLQLTTFLMHQNGSILDGLLLWKRNIDKKFEGVEECYVCYYVLHSSTCQLPKKVCRTCKKKFHSSCLYKWFTTSGHSTCPLCRSIW